jgi:hypothetical protein
MLDKDIVRVSVLYYPSIKLSMMLLSELQYSVTRIQKSAIGY